MSTLIAVRGLADKAYLLERVVTDVQGAIADSGYACERVDVEISRLARSRATSRCRLRARCAAARELYIESHSGTMEDAIADMTSQLRQRLTTSCCA